MTITKAALIDLGERALWTFVEASAGVLVVSGLTDLSVLHSAAIVGLAAVVSVVKSFAASQLGDRSSASTVDGPIHAAIAERKREENPWI